MDCKLNDFNNVVDRNYRNVNSDIGFFVETEIVEDPGKSESRTLMLIRMSFAFDS